MRSAAGVVGWRGRRKVDRALRLGGQVSDPRLASLAAAQAQRQMELLDYRGPLLPSEKAMFVPAVLAIVLFVTLGRGPGDCVLIALVVSVGYLTGDVGLRRLIPTHRRPENRLRRAYEDNLKLAEKAYPG